MAATVPFVCPHCDYKMQVSAAHVGKKGRCPSCQKLVEIKQAPAEEGAPPVPRLPARRPAASASRPGSASTDVPAWLTGLIAAAATAALYLAVFFPVRNTYLGQLFVARGIVPYFSTLVFCWGVATLVLKYVAVKRQLAYAELELELIPLEIGVEVKPENVDHFVDHLAGLPRAQQESILARRIRGALEHFKYRNSVPEVQEYLASQAEIDGSAVDSGYTLMRAFIWTTPILGFIGTVMGISDAVAGLTEAMPATAPAARAGAEPGTAAAGPSLGERMMGAMKRVTDGLATAFDTTLVALVMAILLLFPTESLRKTEYAMLDRIEEFCNESLLRRMDESSVGEAPSVVRAALEGAFQQHQRWLAQWQAQVGELGQMIGADFEAAVARVQDRVAEEERRRWEKAEGSTKVVEELFEKIGRAAAEWERSAESARETVAGSLAASQKLHATMSDNVALMTKLLEMHCELAARSLNGDVRAEIQELRREVAALAPAPVAAAGLSVSPVLPIDGGRRAGLFGRFLGRDSR